LRPRPASSRSASNLFRISVIRIGDGSGYLSEEPEVRVRTEERFRMIRRKPTILLAGIAAAGLFLGACSSNDKADTTTTTMPATTAPAAKTIAEIAIGNPDFSTLVTAVKASGLAEALSGPGPFTVFAPTNEAFAKLPAGTVDTLLKPENQAQLQNILKYHVLQGNVMAKDVKPGKVKTLQGEEITISVDGGNVYLTDAKGNKVQVVKTDIEASNGTIHVINGVLLP